MQRFECSTRIYFGADAGKVLAEFPAERVLIVTDPFWEKNGRAADLAALFHGADVKIFSQVRPDPSVELVAEAGTLCNGWKPDLLVALGGGSAMDCAKGIVYLLDMPVPLVAVPTTSGSGSEMTGYTVLTHNGVKIPVVSSKIRPVAAILDPVYPENMPPSLVADSGMDTLAHSLEALAAVHRSSFTDALAVHAASCVFDCLPRSFQGDCSVRQRLHEAASMAGMAFDQAGLGVCHAMAHALGGAFSVPHGRLCAMLLPAVLQVNEPASAGGYAILAKRLGLPAATEKLAVRSLIGAVERLRRTLRMPENLTQAGVERAVWSEMKEQILQTASKDVCISGNPIPVERHHLERIWKAVAQ